MSTRAASLILFWLLIIAGFVVLGGYSNHLDSHDIARNVLTSVAWSGAPVMVTWFCVQVADSRNPHPFWLVTGVGGLVVTAVAGVVNIVRSM